MTPLYRNLVSNFGNLFKKDKWMDFIGIKLRLEFTSEGFFGCYAFEGPSVAPRRWVVTTFLWRQGSPSKTQTTTAPFAQISQNGDRWSAWGVLPCHVPMKREQYLSRYKFYKDEKELSLKEVSDESRRILLMIVTFGQLPIQNIALSFAFFDRLPLHGLINLWRRLFSSFKVNAMSKWRNSSAAKLDLIGQI